MNWRRWAPAGLRMRLLCVLVPVLVALFAIDSWRDSASLQRELDKAYDQSLLEPAQALADNLGWDADGAVALTEPLHVISMFEVVNGLRKFLRVELQTPDGSRRRVLLGPQHFPEPPATDGVHQAFRERPDNSMVFYSDQVDQMPVRIAALLRVVHDQQGQEWRVLIQTAQSTSRVERALEQLQHETWWRDARTVLVLVLLVWFGIGWGLRPLRRLRGAIEARADEDLQPLATVSVPPEVRPVVDAMNIHLAQQRRAIDTQREFLADASHQLRTPLAIMTTQAGYALREQDPEAVRASLLSMQLQLHRSRRVAEQLLALAHANAHSEPNEHLPRCDANQVARRVVLAALPLALDKKQDLGWSDARGPDAPEEEEFPEGATCSPRAMVAPVRAKDADLHELLANLVHNAVVYTPPEGTINVAVQVVGAVVEITVMDSGPGIAAADRERAFQRFVRLGATAAETPSGSGLGLAIAQAYAQRMGGSVRLTDGDGGRGLLVLVRVPLAEDAT